MYLRRTTRKRKDGSEVGYLQLAHNEWDAKAGHSVVRVLHSFGREDLIDRAAIERLIGSLERWLDPRRRRDRRLGRGRGWGSWSRGRSVARGRLTGSGGRWGSTGHWRGCWRAAGWIRGLSG